MKKLLIIIALLCVLSFIIVVAIAYYKIKIVVKPAIHMESVIDTLSFKTNKESDYFYQKSLNIFTNHTSAADTMSLACSSSFNEKCYVSVDIDTTSLLSVLIDTGSDISLFDINLFRTNQIGWKNSIINTWGKKFPIKNIFIDSITLSKTQFIPYNNPFGGYTRSQNIIGGDILKHFVWKIDNIRREIYFSQDTTAFQHEDCVAIPFVMRGNKPFIKCTVNGIIFDVMLDTGYPDFLHINDTTAINFPMRPPQSEPRDSFYFKEYRYDDINESISNYGLDFDETKICLTISDVQINDISFHNEIIEHNRVVSNLLGWDFIQRFEFIILDYINQVIYLGPDSMHKSFNYLRSSRMYINTTGMMISFSKPHMITVIADSLVEKGLSLLDTIIAIDGKPVTDSVLLKTIFSRDSATITINNGKNFNIYRRHYFSEPDTVVSYGEMALIPLYRNMEITNNKTGGRIFKYFNWGPPYMTSDTWKIFDQEVNHFDPLAIFFKNANISFYNLKVDSIVLSNYTYYNLRIDSVKPNGTLYGIKTDSIFIGK